MTTARRWRLERVRRKGLPVTRVLRSGSGDARLSVSLGAVDEDDAARLLAALQAIEDAGEGAVWLRWHESSQLAALRALGQPDPLAITLAHGRDWSRAPLRVYFDEVYAPWRAAKRPGGWAGEASSWVRILRDIGHVKLGKVDAHVVADYLDDAVVERGRRKGQPLAGNTLRLHRAALQALLKRAFRLRHVEVLPDLAVFRLEGSTARLRDPQPLTGEEARALLHAARTPMHRALFAVGLGTGMRPSELVRVSWEDVSWRPPSLLVRGSKTPRSRDRIPLTPLAARELRAWWVALGEPAVGLAFPSPRGGPYTSTSGFKRALATAAERAGIERPVTPYLLRHTFASLAVGRIERDTAQTIMRHTTDRMLRDVYERPAMDWLSQQARGFDLEDHLANDDDVWP